MKIPLEWLREYVPIRLRPGALAERLTMAGLEVLRVEGTGTAAVLDVEVTPNRPDCLGVRGVAREVAAVTGVRLRPRPEGRGRGPQAVTGTRGPRPRVLVLDAQGCRRYVARVITGVRVGASPGWLVRRLEACGVRPINNVVDVTNYVLLEFGQPLHAFDYDQVVGRTIVVRRARAGERVRTLDQVDRALDPTMLVIADGARPVALAGIMGGLESAVSSQTRTVLLESAAFDPVSVRRTALAFGVSTESSVRFERGVELGGVEAASARAAALLEALAGGVVEGPPIDRGRRAERPVEIRFRVAQVPRVLGMELRAPQVVRYLTRLGCRTRRHGRGALLVRVPPQRRDLRREIDLLEEVIRLHGYHTVPARVPAGVSRLTPGQPAEAGDAAWHAAGRVREILLGCGVTEAITYSLISREALVRTGLEALPVLAVQNPLSAEQEILRPHLLPGLLEVVARNLRHRIEHIRVFELGAVYQPSGGGVREVAHLGVVLAGEPARHWAEPRRHVDVFDLTGVVETLLGSLGVEEVALTPGGEPPFEPDQAAVVTVRGERIGVCGVVAARVREAWALRGAPVVAAQLALPALLAAPARVRQFKRLPSFPSIWRDISLTVAHGTPVQALVDAIRQMAGETLRRVRMLDAYAGAQIPAGQRGLAISLEYVRDDRTLTDAEVNAGHERVRAMLAERFRATIR